MEGGADSSTVIIAVGDAEVEHDATRIAEGYAVNQGKLVNELCTIVQSAFSRRNKNKIHLKALHPFYFTGQFNKK
jgi:hypothetical protein